MLAGFVLALLLSARALNLVRDARLSSRVGRVGGARKDGAGVSRWWRRGGCYSLCGSWWRRLELADLFSCESSRRIWVPLNLFRP